MATPPKLKSMAIISNAVILSPWAKKAKVLAKNGARLPTVCYTVIGTRTAPSENEIRPINPITLRTKSDFLSCGST